MGAVYLETFKFKNMTKKTKQQLVDWLGELHDSCGYTDYFGYEMSIDDFKKEMSKKKKWELQEQVFNASDEGQKFIEE